MNLRYGPSKFSVCSAKMRLLEPPKYLKRHKGTCMRLKIKNSEISEKKKYQDSIFSVYNE